MPGLVTRMAPTPSGYLHLGNLANLLITSWLARNEDGVLALRIDDMDTPRVRPEYIDDIFDVLHWLHIDWQDGPRDADDLAAAHSMARRTDHLRMALRDLQEAGVVTFACSCSRTELASDGTCLRDCLATGRRFVPGESAVRLRLPDITVPMGDTAVHLRSAHGDVVLWRRDDLPAYHLATVVADRDLGTTHIVRGRDLLESSALHDWLSHRLPGGHAIDYRHHDLVTGRTGVKLAKSQGVSSPLPRTEQTREQARDLALVLGAPLGIAPHS